jgi:hypothetical protein
MEHILSFREILDAAERLTPDEQETLMDILNRRLRLWRRAELAREVREAQTEYRKGESRPMSPGEIMKEILP